MADKPITQERLEELDDAFSPYADPTKSVYEIYTTKGRQIVDIGEHVEAWSLNNICFIFEDKKCVANFIHNDKHELWELMEQVLIVYHTEVLDKKTKH